MVVKAIFFPVIVGLLVAGALLLWLNGLGLVILGSLVLFTVAALLRDQWTRHRSGSEIELLPEEEREQNAGPESYGVAMTEVEEKHRESSQFDP